MKTRRIAWRWKFLALGVAAIHFFAQQVSLGAAMYGALGATSRLGEFMASLFSVLIFPLGFLVHSPIGWMFGFPSFGYLALTAANSLLWGSAAAFLVWWLATRRARTSQSR